MRRDSLCRRLRPGLKEPEEEVLILSYIEVTRVLLYFGIAKFGLGHSKGVAREGRMSEGVDCQFERNQTETPISSSVLYRNRIRNPSEPTSFPSLIRNKAFNESPTVVLDSLELGEVISFSELVSNEIGSLVEQRRSLGREGEGELLRRLRGGEGRDESGSSEEESGKKGSSHRGVKEGKRRERSTRFRSQISVQSRSGRGMTRLLGLSIDSLRYKLLNMYTRTDTQKEKKRREEKRRKPKKP